MVEIESVASAIGRLAKKAKIKRSQLRAYTKGIIQTNFPKLKPQINKIVKLAIEEWY